MTKEEILDYVMNTPENTNRMVLNDMLDEFSSGGASAFTVTFLTEDWSTFTTDKTADEIGTAFEAGIPVLGYYGSTLANQIYSIQITNAWPGDLAGAYFQTWYMEGDDLHIITIDIASNNAVTYSETVYTLTPKT